MKKVTYPGELGKPSSTYQHLVAEGPGGRIIHLMIGLLDHFCISRRSDREWFELALRLAKNHVPAFTISSKRRGRKRKAASGEVTPRAVGRPRKWNADAYEILLVFRRKGEKLLRESQSHGKITDVAALKAANARFAKDTSVNLRERVLDRVSRSDAKRLPDARKFVRQSSGN